MAYSYLQRLGEQKRTKYKSRDFAGRFGLDFSMAVVPTRTGTSCLLPVVYEYEYSLQVYRMGRGTGTSTVLSFMSFTIQLFRTRTFLLKFRTRTSTRTEYTVRYASESDDDRFTFLIISSRAAPLRFILCSYFSPARSKFILCSHSLPSSSMPGATTLVPFAMEDGGTLGAHVLCTGASQGTCGV